MQLDAGVRPDARFTWVNGRAHLQSRFAVVDVGRELTWTGTSLGVKAVHRHVLEPRGDGTTRLFSEESMAGPLLVLFFSRAKLRAALEKWLRAIQTVAQA